MVGIRNRGIGLAAGVVLALMASAASAQYINDPSMVEAHGKKEKAVQEAWVMLPQKMKICMDQALAMSNMSFETAIKQKQPPNDPRFATQMDRCQNITSREPRTNFRCTINENGYPVETVCDEVYAEMGGRQPVPLTFMQYVGADLHAKQVDIIEMEVPEARDVRMRAQRPR